MQSALLFVTIFAAFLCSAYAFTTRGASLNPSRRILAVTLAATKDDTNGYGPFGSLVRQGPVPFFIRLAKAETYEAAVQKYMAIEK
jgi:hypothetical protein